MQCYTEWEGVVETNAIRGDQRRNQGAVEGMHPLKKTVKFFNALINNRIQSIFTLF
jgi:hypothetical protein